MMRKNRCNDLHLEEQASLLFFQQESSCLFAQKNERNRSMTNTHEKDTNESHHLLPEELSEQDMQAVKGGAKFGDPQAMLDEARGPFSPSSSFGMGRMEGSVPVAAPKTGAGESRFTLGASAKAETMATITGTGAAFGVGFTSSATKKS
jgi:hypothetical protein